MRTRAFDIFSGALSLLFAVALLRRVDSGRERVLFGVIAFLESRCSRE